MTEYIFQYEALLIPSGIDISLKNQWLDFYLFQWLPSWYLKHQEFQISQRQTNPTQYQLNL